MHKQRLHTAYVMLVLTESFYNETRNLSWPRSQEEEAVTELHSIKG